MLTADLVNARRRGNELRLVPLDDDGARARVEPSPEALVDDRARRTSAERARSSTPRSRRSTSARASVGSQTGSQARRRPLRLRRRRATRPAGAAARRLPRASAARARSSAAERFDRGARPRRGRARARRRRRRARARSLRRPARRARARRVRRAVAAETLVDGYELAQAQAVLLRAVRVTVDVRCASAPGATARSSSGSSSCACSTRSRSTTTGLSHRDRRAVQPVRVGDQVRPAARAGAAGDRRRATRWRSRPTCAGARSARRSLSARGPAPRDARPPTARALARRGRGARRTASSALETPWRVAREHGDPRAARRRASASRTWSSSARGDGDARAVYLEVLGYWSRDAVWRRVELVQAGLAERILFAVERNACASAKRSSTRTLPGALYVYKRTMSAAHHPRPPREALRRRAGVDALGTCPGTGPARKGPQAVIAAKMPRFSRGTTLAMGSVVGEGGETSFPPGAGTSNPKEACDEFQRT